MIFENRHDAALQLIPYLRKYKNDESVVLAIPRGGVPIGYYIAKEFKFPLELLLTKKIGHPSNSELAIGAVSLEGRVLDPRFNVDESYIEAETERIHKSLKERYKKFMGDRQPTDLKNKIVIIVDDGAATGSTILASIEMIRHKNPAKIIVAVPVASVAAAAKIRKAADELICPAIPADFAAVGQFYHDFSEVTDAEVIELLNEMKDFRKAA